jgi:hypothetical protein
MQLALKLDQARPARLFQLMLRVIQQVDRLARQLQLTCRQQPLSLPLLEVSTLQQLLRRQIMD